MRTVLLKRPSHANSQATSTPTDYRLFYSVQKAKCMGIKKWSLLITGLMSKKSIEKKEQKERG